MDRRHENIARDEAPSPSCPPRWDTLENRGPGFCERGVNARFGAGKTEIVQKTFVCYPHDSILSMCTSKLNVNAHSN
jgi:hypothetical protein